MVGGASRATLHLRRVWLYGGHPASWRLSPEDRGRDVVIETDYLVVGAGASGLAFADALVAEGDAVVTVIDRRPAAGGHWLHAYPFVRLHTPSAYYGVNSLALGEDRIDRVGENAGYYERASGGEVCRYFAEAAARLTQTGQVRMLISHEHLGGESNGEKVRDLSTRTIHDVVVRRKVVDARYLEASIPATHAASFAVAPDARVLPVNDLPAAAGSASCYAVVGSGKTAADACIWLLDNGVEPDRIRWIRPRDAWFHDRGHFQPLEQVGAILEGFALDAEAGAHALNVEDLFERLEASGRLVRIDPQTVPAVAYPDSVIGSRRSAARCNSRVLAGTAPTSTPQSHPPPHLTPSADRRAGHGLARATPETVGRAATLRTAIRSCLRPPRASAPIKPAVRGRRCPSKMVTNSTNAESRTASIAEAGTSRPEPAPLLGKALRARSSLVPVLSLGPRRESTGALTRASAGRHTLRPMLRNPETFSSPSDLSERTTGLEPATFGLGGRKTRASPLLLTRFRGSPFS
jgi:hypothetical protein